MNVELVNRAGADETDETAGRVTAMAQLVLNGGQVRDLTPVRFYKEEAGKAEKFVGGLGKVIDQKAWVIFIPPSGGDDGIAPYTTPLREGTIGQQMRAHLIIFPDEGDCEMCAPAIILSERDSEKITDYLARVNGALGGRLLILPERHLMEAAGEVEKDSKSFCFLEEFGLVCCWDYRTGRYHRREFWIPDRYHPAVLSQALPASQYIDLIQNPQTHPTALISYESFWNFLAPRKSEAISTVGSATKSSRIWDIARSGQFILPNFEPLFSDSLQGRDTHGRFTNLKITPPLPQITPEWLVELQDLAAAEKNRLPTLKDRVAQVTLGGMPIYTDLATNAEVDLELIRLLEKIRHGGGGVIIYLDPQDTYSNRDEDQGYHYTLIGVDLTAGSDELRQELWEHYPYYGGETIPLPVLAQRLGLVEVDENEPWEADTPVSLIPSRLTVDFPQFVKMLAQIFNGQIRFGVRAQRDQLFHAHRATLKPTEKRVAKLFKGPKLPQGPDDEEIMARFKGWLLEKDGDLLSAASFYRAFFPS